MHLEYVEINEDNLEIAVKIQNEIFPLEDGRQNYIEGITNDLYRKEITNYIVYNGEIPIGVVVYILIMNIHQMHGLVGMVL